jgi:hypothetical protein
LFTVSFENSSKKKKERGRGQVGIHSKSPAVGMGED